MARVHPVLEVVPQVPFEKTGRKLERARIVCGEFVETLESQALAWSNSPDGSTGSRVVERQAQKANTNGRACHFRHSAARSSQS